MSGPLPIWHWISVFAVLLAPVFFLAVLGWRATRRERRR